MNKSEQDAPRLFLPGWGVGIGPLQGSLAKTRWQPMPFPGTSGGVVPATFAEARDSLLRDLPEVCHLGGWSLGGILAMAAAIAAPERILSLFLLATTPCYICREGWKLGRPPTELQAFMTIIKQEGMAILPRFVGNFCRGDVVPEAAAEVRRNATPMPEAVLNNGLHWLYEADLRAEVAQISCPVTILHGENDPMVPVEVAHWLAEHIPLARLIVLPGRAHAPFAGDDTGLLQELS
ncbi:MAG: alpha/beta fold hydrolase [Zoogloeaceae bacterium]|jgi:pimeloyl-[acyl-carrier protein] methyl ester esterase|nr:alpha/beta fold hydrolase [Zoogloeaceae bacterium]